MLESARLSCALTLTSTDVPRRSHLPEGQDADRSSNGGTEVVNGLIELHRLLALGYRNEENRHLRMLLIAGGLRT